MGSKIYDLMQDIRLIPRSSDGISFPSKRNLVKSLVSSLIESTTYKP